MRTHAPSRIALMLGVLAATWVFTPLSSAAFKNVTRGGRPPAFTLRDLDDREWKSGDIFAGKVTVVVFWATWSPRSREILQDLEKLRAELGQESFQIVAVNADHVEFTSSDRSAISDFARELDLTALVLLDHGLVSYNEYGAMALPSSLVVGRDGLVSFDLPGYPTTMRSDLSDAVRKALGLPTSEELRPPEEYVPMNHALMYYNFGRRLMEKGQDEKGEAQLLESVARDSAFVKPLALLGLYYKGKGRFEEALEHFRKVREIDPSHHEAAYEEAAVSLRSGNLPEAEALFRSLGEEFPTREEFALGLALALKYQGNDPGYREAAGRAAQIEPAAPRVLYEFGGVAENRGDLVLAASLYRRALEASLEREW